MLRKLLTLIALFPVVLIAQVDQQTGSAGIYTALQKLANTSTVLYIAAHPDDENTRLISWFSNEAHANTVYLSLTRGDGGQNLIGTEKGPLLGLLRTQELLEARKIDGGHQFFSRANDFGYSKTADETLAFWDEDEILADVVWAIRKVRPDIIVNRFDHESNGRTHGHHTASAMLAMEAFDLAGDPNAFPEQLRYVDVWQPKRIYFNTSWWFYGSQEAFDEADKSDMVEVDIGAYYPILGRSNNEIAAQSRSMHKCQGFGSAASRGTQTEYLEFLKGDRPEDMNDLFSGIDVTWGRIPGGEKIGKMVDALLMINDFQDPYMNIPGLLELRDALKALPSDPLIERKMEETEQIIRWCAGIYVEVTTAAASVTPGDSLTLDVEVVVRNPVPVSLDTIRWTPTGTLLTSTPVGMRANEGFTTVQRVLVPSDQTYTTPYWLREVSPNPAMYMVPDQTLRGQPETPEQATAEVKMTIDGHALRFEVPVQHKYVDPAIGEIYQPLAVLPPVVVRTEAPVYLFKNGEAADVSVQVKAVSASIHGKVVPEADGWTFEPAYREVDMEKPGSEAYLSFRAIPPDRPTNGRLKVYVEVDGQKYDDALDEVDYDHIEHQYVLRPAEAAIGNIEMEVPRVKVAYLPGSGDEVAASIRGLGVDVTEIPKEEWRAGVLDAYDVVVLGIRSFNVHDELSYFADEIWKFAENGGTVIVQYNTSRRMDKEVAPLPLKLGRDRITEEDASLTMLDPDHPIFTTPNHIGPSDFEHWVQERGLYFASEWGEAFTPLLEGHDTGEDDVRGMLLVAPYGKGQYIYTGLSFFRQLPAGVPGAYRLFMNLLAFKTAKE